MHESRATQVFPNTLCAFIPLQTSAAAKRNLLRRRKALIGCTCASSAVSTSWRTGPEHDQLIAKVARLRCLGERLNLNNKKTKTKTHTHTKPMTSKLKLLDQKNSTGRKHDQLIASRHDRTAKAVDFAGGGGLCCASAGRKQSTGTWSKFANLQA